MDRCIERVGRPKRSPCGRWACATRPYGLGPSPQVCLWLSASRAGPANLVGVVFGVGGVVLEPLAKVGLSELGMLPGSIPILGVEPPEQGEGRFACVAEQRKRPGDRAIVEKLA